MQLVVHHRKELHRPIWIGSGHCIVAETHGRGVAGSLEVIGSLLDGWNLLNGGVQGFDLVVLACLDGGISFRIQAGNHRIHSLIQTGPAHVLGADELLRRAYHQ